MAVYTQLGAKTLADLVAQYDVGDLVSAKGIAEGVSNSNWLVETTGSTGEGAANGKRFILTMYERRIDTEDLPFFLGLLDHLSGQGLPVPRTIHDKSGRAWRTIAGKAVALIEFLPGVSVDAPSAAQAHNVGKVLAEMHLAGERFGGSRTNDLGPSQSANTLVELGEVALAGIDGGLPAMLAQAQRIESHWPSDLPRSIIHADLFPDNVLMLGDKVSGLIDFYFACEDVMAYDLAVTHAAWCFEDEGRLYRPELGRDLVQGYESVRPLSPQERAAMPLLAQGACMRFVASRAQDWIDTPADALVTRKDPMDFVRRFETYRDRGGELFGS